MLTVENVIPKTLFSITGDVYLSESPDFGDNVADLPSAPPVNIIQTDQTLYVHFWWRQTGWITKLMSRSNKWECRVFIEQMGKGEVADDPTPGIISFQPVPGARYHKFVAIPGRTLKPGAYRLVATLSLSGETGDPTPLAAYEELGILQVYND